MTSLDELDNVGDALIFDGVWLVIGTLVVTGGCPVTLGPGVTAKDTRTGDTVVVIRRDTKAAAGQVCVPVIVASFA